MDERLEPSSNAHTHTHTQVTELVVHSVTMKVTKAVVAVAVASWALLALTSPAMAILTPAEDREPVCDVSYPPLPPPW